MPALRPVDLADKVIVITGANSGIGKEAAVVLARWGARVVMTSRSEVRGGPALAEVRRRSGSDTVELVALDLASFDSIHACADELLGRYDRLDVLLNNAGGIISERRTTREGFELTFGVNHLGHFLLTQLLLERLTDTARDASEPSRIVNVASLAHRGGRLRFDDLQFERRSYNGTTAYNQSKLANVVFTLELARRLDAHLVTANSCHPGPVRTGFGAAEDTRGIERLGIALGRPFMISPAWGARVLIHLASAPAFAARTGGYYVGGYLGRSGRHQPSRRARDPQAGRRLWEISEQLVAEGEQRRRGGPPPGPAVAGDTPSGAGSDLDPDGP